MAKKELSWLRLDSMFFFFRFMSEVVMLEAITCGTPGFIRLGPGVTAPSWLGKVGLFPAAFITWQQNVWGSDILTFKIPTKDSEGCRDSHCQKTLVFRWSLVFHVRSILLYYIYTVYIHTFLI